jgi:hypothetical protein
MHFTSAGVGLLVALVCGQAETKKAPAEEDPIVVARSTLYTTRAQSLAVLEEAVRKWPERVDYWVELLRALDVDGEPFLADCTSRRALTLHPQSSELWLARIALLNQGRGLRRALAV